MADPVSFRYLPPEARPLACQVLEASLAEMGYGPSHYPGSLPVNTPPLLAHKAWSLAMLAVDETPCPFSEWVQRCITHEDPETVRRWRRYFTRHEVTA